MRNALLGRRVGDVDLATPARPEAVMAAAQAAGLKAIPTGLTHGTVTVIAEGHPFEITTLREDVETYGRHAKVAFTADWAADARRRDFTINALYCGADGALFDPLAAGRPGRNAAFASSAMRASASARTTCVSCASSASPQNTPMARPIGRASKPPLPSAPGLPACQASACARSSFASLLRRAGRRWCA